MSARSPWGPRLVALLILLAVLLAPIGLGGLPSEAALAAPPPQATVQPGAGRAGHSPTVVGDINNDGIVDIRDYGTWRTNFGQTNCDNVADLDANCIVDVRDYGVWRQNFGQTGPTLTPTPTVPATNCIPVGAICSAKVSALVGTMTGTIVLADCANPEDPMACARLVSVANGFTVTGQFGLISQPGINLTIAVVDATTGAPAGTRTVNCPVSRCSNVLVSGNVRPQLGGSVVLSGVPGGAPDSTGLRELAVAAPDLDPA